jgi:protein ImuA
MSDSPTPLARLKRRLDRLERRHARSSAGLFALGAAGLDARLGGGLARGALHELCWGADDHGAVSSFALMLALCAQGEGARPLLWVREDKGERMHGRLYGPGMAELGANPDDMILVHAPDTLSALRVGADILGCMGLGAVVIEPFGAARALDLTASRKLVLAAERSGVAAFILREGESRFSSAAATRWQIAARPSQRLAGEAPGQPRLGVELVRHRGGVAPFSTDLEWNRDTRSFVEPAFTGAALSRPVLADPARRSLAA